MRFLRNHWFYIGGVLFVGLAFFVGFFGDDIDPLRKMLLLSFMALLVHQFEEYALPGGFPPIMNLAIEGEKEAPDRYPLNRQTSLIVNVVIGYPFYLLAVALPEWYWLGILTMLFGIAQLGFHGVAVPRKMKTLYNPGLASVVLLHVPIGIYYLWYIGTHATVAPWHWWVGVGALPIAFFLIIHLPIRLLRDRASSYAWTQEEMNRFRVAAKLRKP
jgi:hypothetical protein